MALNYTLVDNPQVVTRKDNYHYFRWSFESAGNLLEAYSTLIGKDKFIETDTDGEQTNSYYKILNTRFVV